MMTKQPDHTEYREWLHLEPDGELNAGQRSSLQQHLSSCASCRRERDELVRLQALLDRAKVPVSESLVADVMAGLPAAGWETRSPRTWVAALIAVVLLSIASALLIASGGDTVLDAAPLAAAAAVWELLSSSALAGAGLLAASWKGLGVVIEDVLGRSIWNLLALGALVICLDVALFRLLFRRRRPETETVDQSD